MLSVGDRGGRVITFRLGENEQGEQEYEYMTEFQAHQKQFDVLSSVETSETVVSLEWINSLKTSQPSLLTSNHKQVKCFRLYSKKIRKVESVKKKI